MVIPIIYCITCGLELELLKDLKISEKRIKRLENHHFPDRDCYVCKGCGTEYVYLPSPGRQGSPTILAIWLKEQRGKDGYKTRFHTEDGDFIEERP